MAKITSLQTLLVSALQDLHDAERQLVEALPRFAGAAHDGTLARLFATHLEETREHVRRLERGFALLLAGPGRRRSTAMFAMVAAANGKLRARVTARLRDVALIAHAQKAEHFEIASYTAAHRLAEVLGFHELAALLRETLDEETAASGQLGERARALNVQAPGAGTIRAAADAKPRPLLSMLRALLPGRFGTGATTARRPPAFDASSADFTGQRKPRRRATRVKSRSPAKTRKTTKPKRASARPAARSTRKRAAIRRKKPRRTKR